MLLNKRIKIIVLVSFSVVVLDRITKLLAVTILKDGSPQSYVFDMLTLSYSENSGAMLSLGSQLSEELRFYIFTVLVGLGLAIGLFYKRHYRISDTQAYGSGLGLAIAQKIVDLHAGKLTFLDKNKDEGLVARVSLQKLDASI